MSRPIRIAFVVHVMQVAGAEVLVRELIRRAGSRLVPSIFCLDEIGRMGEEMRAEGIDIITFNRRPGLDWGVARRMAKAIHERELDVVHAHQYTPFYYSAIAKLIGRRKAKLILTEHGRHYPDVVSRKRRWANKLLLARTADAVTACCEFSANGLAANDGFKRSRIEIIENGIEVDRYGPHPEPDAQARVILHLHSEPDAQARVILHVARHHPVKDQATLIRGFALAAPDLPGVTLQMAGDGPLRGTLETLAKELNVADRVQFLGIRSDIPDLMRQADVFALTSLSEAASLTLLEAMASGLPAVVTDVGGNGEIVRHEKEGLLFPRSDAAGCAAAFKRLFADPAFAKRLGEAGRERAREHYRLETAVNRYLALFEQVMQRS
jgi:glycosyltransferase involved in cell wall biosynthesis